MMGQGIYRSLMSYISTCVLVVGVAACGGGGGGDPSGGTPPAAVEPGVTADPGDIVAVRVGDVANLDGTRSSTSTNNSLTYAWSSPCRSLREADMTRPRPFR